MVWIVSHIKHHHQRALKFKGWSRKPEFIVNTDSRQWPSQSTDNHQMRLKYHLSASPWFARSQNYKISPQTLGTALHTILHLHFFSCRDIKMPLGQKTNYWTKSTVETDGKCTPCIGAVICFDLQYSSMFLAWQWHHCRCFPLNYDRMVDGEHLWLSTQISVIIWQPFYRLWCVVIPFSHDTGLPKDLSFPFKGRSYPSFIFSPLI